MKNKDKNKKTNKKTKFLIVCLMVLAAVVVAMGIIISIILNQLSVLSNRIAFLTDTSDIILSSVNSLQSNIESTLEEESSLLESWEIKLVDTDFAAKTYTVSVSVIPKQYTDTTTANIYFGTNEYQLALNGYSYEGLVTLPLGEKFDSNVTLLFIDGDKKNTEIVRGYKDVQLDFRGVIYGNASKLPSYEDGKLKLTGAYDFVLSGQDEFNFTDFEIIVEENGKMLDTIDIKTMAENKNSNKSEDSEDKDVTDDDAGNGTTDSDSNSDDSSDSKEDNTSDETLDSDNDSGNNSGNGSDSDSTNDSSNDSTITTNREQSIVDDDDYKTNDEDEYDNLTIDDLVSGLDNISENASDHDEYSQVDASEPDTIYSLAGTYNIDTEYEVAAGKQIRIYMRAITQDGYRFEYDLFNGTTIDAADSDTVEEDDQESDTDIEIPTGFETSVNYLAANYSVYDSRGAKYEKQ